MSAKERPWATAHVQRQSVRARHLHQRSGLMPVFLTARRAWFGRTKVLLRTSFAKVSAAQLGVAAAGRGGRHGQAGMRALPPQNS